MNFKYLLIGGILISGNNFVYSDEMPGLLIESAPASKYQQESGYTLDEPLFMDTAHGTGGAVPAGVVVSTPAPATIPVVKNKSTTTHVQYPGRFESAPEGKYRNKPESSVFDVPLFLDDSGSTGGEVPLSPYIIYEIDLDPGPNGVSFSNASQFVRLGLDKRVASSNWTLGGWVSQSGSIDGINGSSDANLQVTQARIQAAYGTSFGLVNIIRADELIFSGNNTPSYQTQRFEDFLRWDTQYSKLYYEFAGQRVRVLTNGGWDYRGFIGQGFQFTDRDNWETTIMQQWVKLGNGSQTGVFNLQHLSTAYSHTFANKVTLYGDIEWEGSNYATQTYSNSFGFEAGMRVPF